MQADLLHCKHDKPRYLSQRLSNQGPYTLPFWNQAPKDHPNNGLGGGGGGGVNSII